MFLVFFNFVVINVFSVSVQLFCGCVWMRGHIEVMRLSQMVTNAVWSTRGHMDLSLIIGQFVNSNGTHSSNITFCLSEKPAIFNDMSPTPRNFHNFHFDLKTGKVAKLSHYRLFKSPSKVCFGFLYIGTCLHHPIFVPDLGYAWWIKFWRWTPVWNPCWGNDNYICDILWIYNLQITFWKYDLWTSL